MFRSIRPRSAVAAFVALATLALVVFGDVRTTDAAQVEYFLKMDRVQGDSKDPSHYGWTRISAFDLGAADVGAGSSNRGGGASKAHIGSIHFTNKVDVSTAGLVLAVNTGRRFPTITLEAVPAKSTQTIQYVFYDALVTRIDVPPPGHGNVLPPCQFWISFTKMVASYRQLKANGTPGEWVKVTETRPEAEPPK